MKMISKRTTSALALAAGAALVLSSCASGGTDNPGGNTGGDDTLKVATLLPLSGSLGFLLPPVQAGVAQALADIEAAGGVLGNPVEIVAEANEGDGSDITVVEKGRDEVIASGAAFVLGALSSSRTLHVVESITDAGILMGSPSNTATALSGISPNYFRTAPPDSVQGSALAQQILADGHSSIGYLTFNDDYGLGLRDTIQQITEENGATTVYGGKGDGNEFPVDQGAFSAEVTALKAANPDAIVIVTFDQINTLLPELLNQGVDPSILYLVDGNANSFADVVDAGTVVGMQASIPGAQADPGFKAQLEAIYSETYGKDLESLTYAPEAYDLVMITALAAEKAGAADSASIQAQLGAVTGANGGEECTSFADCKALIADGADIHYVGKAGTGPLNANNDPSAAWIGIYKYDDSNTPQFVSAVFGES